MAYRVDISLSALQDAEDAYLWIMRRAPSQVGAWYEGLLKAIYGLEQNPTRCPMAPESEDVGIQEQQSKENRVVVKRSQAMNGITEAQDTRTKIRQVA